MFGAAERAWLCAGDAAGRDDRLIALWTVKEALGKADGRGIHRGALHSRLVDIPAFTAALARAEGEFTRVTVDGDSQALVARRPTHWLTVVVPRASGVPLVSLEIVAPATLAP